MREPKDVSILIADDEESLRNAMVFDFKRKGFKVFEAENGIQAFEIVKNNKIDVVLTDVRMPGGSGIDLLDNIKTINQNLPVVMFITGFSETTLEEAYDKGVDAVFAKPFDRKALLAAVIKTITDRDARWSSRKLERFETNFIIELNFPDLNNAVGGRVLNVGRGGFFVALNDHFPNVEAKTTFKIKFDHGTLGSIEGHGTVRWVRTTGTDELPAGYGVEFDYLSDESRVQIIHLVNELKTNSFIPKA